MIIDDNWLSSVFFVSKISGSPINDLWEMDFRQFQLLKDKCIDINTEMAREAKGVS